METIKFKTTIKCAGCIAKATPYLNETIGEGNWMVDVDNPDKILSIASVNELDVQLVINALSVAGFKAEHLN